MGDHNGNNNHMTMPFTYIVFHTDIHLVPPRELVEGQPLQLTCNISGHTPTDIHKVKINYWSRSSGDPIANCSNDEATHKLPESDIDHDVLTSTCKLSTHSTQSNSGDYYCTATTEHMEVSSEDIAVNVEPRIHWKTITSAAVGSAGLIVLVSSLLLAIVIRKSYVKCKHRPGVPPEEEIADENVHLLHNDRDGIRENNISKGLYSYYNNIMWNGDILFIQYPILISIKLLELMITEI